MSPAAVVSVVVPLFQKRATVGEAVASVLAQSVRDLELVVVDDGSTDGGAGVVRAVGDPRVRVIVQGNAGAAAARNRGVAASSAPVVAFLDADDVWGPDHLETILRLAAAHPECAVFATGYVFRRAGVGDAPAVVRGVPPPPWEGVLERYFEVAAESDPPLWTSATAVRREALLAVGGFPEGVAAGEDLLTWARLAARFRIAYAPRPSAVFRKFEPGPGGHGRVPDPGDPVGRELRRLVEEHGGEGLRRYAALWHRMRASIYLQIGRSREAAAELRECAALGGPGSAPAALRALARLPGPLAQRAFLLLRRARVRGRARAG